MMRIVIVGAGVAGCIMARTLARLPGAEVICLERVAQNDGWSIRWSELYRVLRDAAAPAISYDCTISAIGGRDDDPARSFIEWSENSSHRRIDNIDLLIATDGRYSQVRRRSPENRIRTLSASRSRACWCPIPAPVLGEKFGDAASQPQQ